MAYHVVAYPRVVSGISTCVQGPSGADDDFDDDKAEGQHTKWEGTTWRLCLEAVGDCGWAFNGTYQYPNCSGHWHYNDPTCDLFCQCGQLMFVTLTSLIGLQDFPGNAEDAAGGCSSDTLGVE